MFEGWFCAFSIAGRWSRSTGMLPTTILCLLICHTSWIREKPLSPKYGQFSYQRVAGIILTPLTEFWLWHLTCICSCAGDLFQVSGLSMEKRSSKLQGLFWGLSERAHIHVCRMIFSFYERSTILVPFHRNYHYLLVT